MSECLRQIDKYQIYPEHLKLKCSIQLNLSYILTINNFDKSQALILLDDTIFLSKKAGLLQYLAVAQARKGMICQDEALIRNGFKILELSEQNQLLQQLVQEREQHKSQEKQR